MSERNFRNFPHNADRPKNARVSNEQRLESPAKKVSRREDVQMTPYPLDSNVRTVHSVFLVHVYVKVL